MQEIIKVLQINSGDGIYGGGSAFLFNVYKFIDKSKVQFDFLTPNNTTFESKRDMIENMGGHIYEFHTDQSTIKGLYAFLKKMRTFMGTHHYDIVHINMGSDNKFGIICALILKRFDVKIVMHSHNPFYGGFMKRILLWPLKWFAYLNSDLQLACSQEAAYGKFPKCKVDKGKVQVIKNGIDTNLFAYNEDTRNKIRSELNIQDSLVIGNVGRLSSSKNQAYLLKIFKEISKQNANARLMLIGEGELLDKLTKQASEMGVLDKILFLGFQENTEIYYQAMDAFVFPSLYEGLAIVLIEAQTSGLPCFINEDLSKESNITELIHRLPIIEDPVEWSKVILSYVTFDGSSRRSYEQEVENAGYSVSSTAEILTGLYESVME